MTRLSPIGATRKWAVIFGPIVCLLLSGCGRLGFATDEVVKAGASPDDPDDDDGASEETPAPIDDDERDRPGRDPDPPRDDASIEQPELDASAPSDGGAATPSDSASASPDGGTVGPDGAMSDPDGGRRGPGRLDCGERNNSNTLVCASFDRDFPNRSTARTSNGDIQIDQERLQAKTFKEEGSAALDMRFDAQSSGSLYLATWLKIPEAFELSAMNIVGLQATSGSDPSVDVNLIAPGVFEIFAAQDQTTELAPDFLVPRGEWLCMKAQILLSSSGGIDLSIDGMPLFVISNVDTLPPVGVDQLSIGFDWTGPTQAPATILFDNVILSTKEIVGDCP